MVLGIDFTEEYIAVSLQGEENALVFPAVICREKKEDTWYIGEDAYRMALAGQGVITEKLLKLLFRDGTSTVYHRSYTAGELVTQLFRKVMEKAVRGTDLSGIETVCLAVHKPDAVLMDRISGCLEQAGIPKDRQILITHEEAFVHYALSREKDLASSMVALFDLSGERLSYYEFMMVRGASRKACVAEGEDLEEGFHASILKNDSGRELGDRIMTDVARRKMEGRLFSAVLLTGAGFEQTDWAGSFLAYVCQRRRVLQENGLFAHGAALCAEKSADGAGNEGCLIFCDSRISSEISILISVRERESRLVLVPAGERWYGCDLRVELLPRGQDYIDFAIEPFDSRKKKRTVRAGLSGLPVRPDRTTRIALEMSFRAADRAEVCISDMGFGELFPSSGQRICEEIVL